MINRHVLIQGGHLTASRLDDVPWISRHTCHDKNRTEGALRQRGIDLGGSFHAETALLDVADDAHDFAHGWFAWAVAVGNARSHVLSNGVLVGKESPRQRAVDDYHRCRLRIVAFREVPARNEGYAQRTKVIRFNGV